MDTFSIMVKARKAIWSGVCKRQQGNQKQKENQKALHLFQKVSKGFVKYLGEMEYVDDFVEEGRDTRGNLRKVIVFKLKPKERWLLLVQRYKAAGVIAVIMFDRAWKMLQEIDASERKKAFDAIVELLATSEDEEMLQLRDDLLTFEDDILDDSEDPIKTLLGW